MNKAAKIREAFETLGADARPKDVIAHLAASKIKVPASQVSAIKGKLGAKKPGRKSEGGLIALPDLIAAKKLINQLGSIEKAQTALSALAKLR